MRRRRRRFRSWSPCSVSALCWMAIRSSRIRSDCSARVTIPHALAFNAFGFVLPGLLMAVVAWQWRKRLSGGAPWAARIAARLALLSALAFAAQGLLPLDPADLDAPASHAHATAWMLWWVALLPARVPAGGRSAQGSGAPRVGAGEPGAGDPRRLPGGAAAGCACCRRVSQRDGVRGVAGVDAAGGAERERLTSGCSERLPARRRCQPWRSLSTRIVIARMKVIAFDTIIGHECSTRP